MTAVIPTRRGRGQALSRPISIICGPETLQTQPQGGIRKEGPLDGLSFSEFLCMATQAYNFKFLLQFIIFSSYCRCTFKLKSEYFYI